MSMLNRDITPAQVIIPLIVGAVVFVVASVMTYVPPLPDWTIAKTKRELREDTHIAAAATLDELQVRSFANNFEYCGYLYRTSNGISASPAKAGDAASCTIDYDFGERSDEGWGNGFGVSFGEEEEVIATYHSHAGYDTEFDNEAPSINDLRITIHEGVDDFIATPGGRLWYLSAEYEAAILICDQGCLQTDQKFVPCPSDETAESYRLDDLIARGKAEVTFC